MWITCIQELGYCHSLQLLELSPVGCACSFAIIGTNFEAMDYLVHETHRLKQNKANTVHISLPKF